MLPYICLRPSDLKTLWFVEVSGFKGLGLWGSSLGVRGLEFRIRGRVESFGLAAFGLKVSILRHQGLGFRAA